MKEKSKGFTLVELLGVLVILSVIIGLAFATFTSVRDKTLQSDYENVVSYLETKAGNYAKDTGITTVSVGKLIEEGYAEPDDETDIYDPRNNKSLNCYIISSTYENGNYNSLFDKELTKEDGTCDSYTETNNHIIYKIDAQNNYVPLDNNEYPKDGVYCYVTDEESNKIWCNGDIYLGVVKHDESSITPEEVDKYEWTSSTGNRSSESTIKTNISLVSQSTYKARVYYKDKKIGEATKNINIDKEAPKIVDVKTDKNWKSLEKNISVTLSDGNGSGIEGIYVGTESTCPTSGYKEVKEGKYEFKVELQTVDSEEKRYICTIDKVGNISSEAYEIIVSNKDKEAADMYDLTGSPTEWTKNNVTLTGSAQDYKSGLVAYKFVKSTTTPNISATDSDWKTDIGVDKNAVVSKTNVVTENNVSNERWYYCVKDEVGNVGCSKGYQVTNIDNLAPNITSITHTPTNSTLSNVTLVGKAHDEQSGLTDYVCKKNSVNPSDNEWNKVTDENNITCEITQNGTYYFWTKDAVGNTSYKTYNISNIHVLPKITNVYTTNITSNSFTINVTALAGTSPLKTYYFSINGGSSWTTLSSSSTSVSKTITGLNANTLYNIKVKVVDTSNYESNPYSTSARTANQILLATYVKNKYTYQGSNNLYYHISSLANSAGDNSYRYSGANPNNYVCFGSDASSCPSNNLYRIIGVFGSQVKLIKATHVEGMVDWCGNTGSNRVDCKTWSNSYLNNSVLNSTYLNSLGSTWSNKISYTTWYTGEVDMQNVLGSNAKTAYNYEIGYNKPSGTTYAKVGLMYVSEFFYAASPNYWRYPGFGCVNGGMDENGRCLNTSDYRLAQNNNWLLSSPTSSNFGQEVLITRFYKPNTAWGTIVGFIHFQNNGSDRGTAFAGSALANNASFYRPAFNLNTNVYYTSGSGTEYDPIRIK